MNDRRGNNVKGGSMIYNYPLDGGVFILDLYVKRDRDVKLSFNAKG